MDRAAPPAQPPEQARYARWLERSTGIGLVLLVLAFGAYLLGVAPPLVPVDRLPELWGLSAAEFQRASGSPAGWAWLAGLRHPDLAGLAGIAVLAGCSLPCLLAVMPLYARRGERVLMIVCALEVLVLLAAASGLASGGH